MMTGTRLRQVHFQRRWWTGVDARQVQQCIHRVAVELDRLAGEVAVVREENTRLKAALRQWQTAVGVAPVQPPTTARHQSKW